MNFRVKGNGNYGTVNEIVTGFNAAIEFARDNELSPITNIEQTELNQYACKNHGRYHAKEPLCFKCRKEN